MWRRVQRTLRPFTVMMPVEPGEPQAALGRAAPVGGGDAMNDGATAYVCGEFVCAAPVIDPEAVS